MIIGIGTDLCYIDRIRKAFDKSNFFRDNLFRPEEIEYCESKGEGRYESYAAMFAAREAFCKASGKSLEAVMYNDNFKLIHDTDGSPSIKLSGDLVIPSAKIFVSITHEKGYALAFVVIEKKEGV